MQKRVVTTLCLTPQSCGWSPSGFRLRAQGTGCLLPLLAHGATGARATNLSMYTLHVEMFSWEEKSEILLDSQKGVRPLERLQSTGT